MREKGLPQVVRGEEWGGEDEREGASSGWTCAWCSRTKNVVAMELTLSVGICMYPQSEVNPNFYYF